MTDFDKLETEGWFDYNLQKIVSVSASIMSLTFSNSFGKIGYFDARAFNIPKEEVVNYFIWRQKDWERNSVQMLAQFYYSHKQLYKKNVSDMHEMLLKKNVDWSKLPLKWREGTFFYKESSFILRDAPSFLENSVIEAYLKGEE